MALCFVSGCEQHAATIATSCPKFPPPEPKKISGVLASTQLEKSTMVPASQPPVPIPSGSIQSVRIVLERTACFGSCPDYKVEVRGSGEILFHGNEHVLVPGFHRSQIDPSKITCLLDNFRVTNFWSLLPEYTAPITDSPTYRVTLSIAGHTKSVTDYVGREVGMPSLVTSLENSIDNFANTESWINGNSRTIAALEAEKFDFQSPGAGELLVRAATRAPDSVVMALIERNAPMNARTQIEYADDPVSAVEAAAMYGRLGIMKALIEHGAFTTGGKALISATLRASVASRRIDVVREVLKYGPDINSTDKRGDTALALVFTGAHPGAADESSPDESAAVIRLLGAQGADPNRPSADGDSLLSRAYGTEERQALVSLGAR